MCHSLSRVSLPSMGDPCLPFETGRECNQIMTRYSKLPSPVGKAGRQGAWKGEASCFLGHCLLILQLPLSPSPFLPFCLLHPGFSLPPSWILLPPSTRSQGRFGGERGKGQSRHFLGDHGNNHKEYSAPQDYLTSQKEFFQPLPSPSKIEQILTQCLYF